MGSFDIVLGEWSIGLKNIVHRELWYIVDETAKYTSFYVGVIIVYFLMQYSK